MEEGAGSRLPVAVRHTARSQEREETKKSLFVARVHQAVENRSGCLSYIWSVLYPVYINRCQHASTHQPPLLRAAYNVCSEKPCQHAYSPNHEARKLGGSGFAQDFTQPGCGRPLHAVLNYAREYQVLWYCLSVHTAVRTCNTNHRPLAANTRVT